MPVKPPRICGCGQRVEAGAICPCQAKRSKERKARHDAKRPSARQRGYTREWEKASKEFLASFPKCRRCDEPAALVDHKIPHRGDMTLFWDQSNWQGLCRHHHNSAKQSEERRLPRGH